MNIKKIGLRWPLVILSVILVAVLFFYRQKTFHIDTDIVASLPQTDQVLTDSRYVIQHLPHQDKVVIDLSLEKPDRDRLVEGANLIEAMLMKSGYFRSVGIDEMQKIFPGLLDHIVTNLPYLFDAEELEKKVKPLLVKTKINERLTKNLEMLQSIDGIGQSKFIEHDPLDLKSLVLSRIADLVPSKNAGIYKGKLLSSDEKHLLVIAELKSSGIDLKSAKAVDDLINRFPAELNKNSVSKKDPYIMNPVGAYRAVMDNEKTTKSDTEQAVTISTIVIAILLFIGFPRPLIGLLALVPSIIGTAIAFIVYSFIHNSISILAIGFGGAIIAFTVDYGITYLLFLDRPYETYGLKATKESWSLGLLAMLTTACSFFFLFISGFPALAQIGEFAALGVLFTYLCVHGFFPLLFPVLPPAKRKGILPLQPFVKRLVSSKGKYKIPAAVIFCIIMLFFAKPVFHIDLSSMNSVSDDTLASEKLVKDIWGDIFNRVYLMTEGRSPDDLQDKGDRLTVLLNRDMADGVIESAFVPSMIFPGRERLESNFNAWKKFWNKSRTAELKKNLYSSADETGFSREAFSSLFQMISKEDAVYVKMPAEYYSLFGISKPENFNWIQFSSITTSEKYNGESFYERYTGDDVKIFDPMLFSERLGSMLMSGFIKMAVIVGLISILVAFIYLADWHLALLTMAPTIFGLICTFGTLKLLNEPLGIPTIMVTVAVIGMGTDYAIYIVRAYQRYMDENNTHLRLVHLSMFLAFATTFVGFGLLAFSDHSLLRSAGLCLGLGIGYSFVGAILLVPPVLSRLYMPVKRSTDPVVPGSKEHLKRVLLRYKHMEPYPRFFARFKIKLDPMFPKLAEFLKSPKNIVDIGCGYGVPSVWIAEAYPDAQIYGIDPDLARVSVASRALDSSGIASIGTAPGLPAIKDKFDTALLLDMAHYLNDPDFTTTLKWINSHLIKKGRLIIRITIPSDKTMPWERWLEKIRVTFAKFQLNFRPQKNVISLVKKAGFKVIEVSSTKKNREETWIIADK
ncbi:MAG: methyltransferase domain-containing protein [Spirochaetes bacterium]|nr:methyltransferase domain-containing protein [Spirochaetota bacterium]